MQETIKLPKRYWGDEKWALEHLGELQEKYTNKWVAIVNKKVAGIGEDGDIARREAQKKTGVKEIPVIFVESGQNLYFTFTSKVPLIIGIRDLLEKFDLHILFSQNRAYLEETI